MKLVRSFVLALFLPAVFLRAQSDPNEWSHRQSLSLTAPGLVRWTVPSETLNLASPDRRDLRLLDPQNQEVPYLLDEPRREGEGLEPVRNFKSEVLENQTILRFSPAPGTTAAALFLASPEPKFLKGVQVEARVGGAWKILARNQVLFRETWGAENLVLEFPPITADAFKIVIDDKKTPAIPWVAATLRRPARPAEDAQTTALRVLRRDDGPTETRLRLELPARNVFIEEVSLESPDPLFQRSMTLLVEGVQAAGDLPGQGITEWPLASGTLYRVALDGFESKEKTDLWVDSLVRAREVVLVIRNGDNPPMAVNAVWAKILPARLIFRGAISGTYRLVVGNPRAAAPVYDLAGLRSALIKGPFQSADAGPLEPNPSYRPVDVLPELPEWGAALDVSAWTHRDPVTISGAGFHRLELTPPVLAAANPAGRDLRLVRDGKQLPFLIDRTPAWRSLVPTVKPLGEEKGKSRWELTLPQDRLPAGYLECRVTNALFQRSVTVYETRSDERGQTYQVPLAQTQWSRTGGSGGERRLVFLQGNPAGRRLVVEIDNGDNAPLSLEGFKIHYRTFGIIFKAGPGAPLWLAYGNPRADWPRYDLSVVSEQVLTADRSEASLGEGEARKRHWAAAELGGAKKVIFWLVLGLVVVVLLWVLRYLLPSEEPKAGTPKKEPRS